MQIILAINKIWCIVRSVNTSLTCKKKGMKMKKLTQRSLKSIRIDLGYTQEEMAKMLNINYTTYQKKERGESPLLAIELAMISKYSGVDMKDIEILK